MCAPSVIDVVRQDISRRHFLAALGGSAATAVAAPAAGHAQEKPVRLGEGFREVHDLTHTFSARLPVFPAFKPMQIRQRFTIARDGFFANEITFDEHTGTHLDAPVHFIANGGSADRIAVDRLIAPLAVVSIQDRAAKDADAMVAVDDLLAWEKRYGRLPAGAFVAMHSGWEARSGMREVCLTKKEGRRERLRPCRAEDKGIRGEASAKARAGGGAPAPLKMKLG